MIAGAKPWFYIDVQGFPDPWTLRQNNSFRYVGQTSNHSCFWAGKLQFYDFMMGGNPEYLNIELSTTTEMPHHWFSIQNATPDDVTLVGKCQMSACWPDPPKDRHEMSEPTCWRHVDWLVADIVQKRVAESTDTTHPNTGFSSFRKHVGKKLL